MKVNDVLCPFCGCLCDDLIVEIEDNKIISVDNGCSLSQSKFLSERKLKSPIRRINNGWEEISLEEAVEDTVQILTSAERPLLYGWSGTQGEAQCAGVHICEVLRGVIDSTTSVCHGPSIMAIQEVGHPGCTLGQIKNRADLIVYWGCNTLEAHPRHLSRYTTYADGYFMENAFRDRKLIVVDVRNTETANVADEFVRIEPGGDYAVLSALRALVRGRGASIPDTVAGVPRQHLEKVAKMMKEAKFGALFFGVGLTMTRGKYKNIRNAIELVDELSRHTKFTLTPMRGHWNVYGSNEVFTWMTGYPYGIDFSRGVAFYNPGETTAVDILAKKECDACLVVSSDPAAHFPRACMEHLASVPLVQLDPFTNCTTTMCEIQIPVALTGVDVAGTAYRMDGIPLRMKKLLDSDLPSDTDVLKMIYTRTKEVLGIE